MTLEINRVNWVQMGTLGLLVVGTGGLIWKSMSQDGGELFTGLGSNTDDEISIPSNMGNGFTVIQDEGPYYEKFPYGEVDDEFIEVVDTFNDYLLVLQNPLIDDDLKEEMQTFPGFSILDEENPYIVGDKSDVEFSNILMAKSKSYERMNELYGYLNTAVGELGIDHEEQIIKQFYVETNKRGLTISRLYPEADIVDLGDGEFGLIAYRVKDMGNGEKLLHSFILGPGHGDTLREQLTLKMQDLANENPGMIIRHEVNTVHEFQADIFTNKYGYEYTGYDPDSKNHTLTKIYTNN